MKRKDIKKRPLSDTVIEALEPEGSTYRERHADGVYLRVRENGMKDWQLRYKKPDGQWTWLGLGACGKGAGQLSGQEAREKALQKVKEAKDRCIPLAEVNSPTAPDIALREPFSNLMSEWLEIKRKDWTPGTFTRAERMLAIHVSPAMGDRPYRNIPASEWFNLFKGMEAAGLLETLAKTRAYCQDIYALAQVTDRTQYNPIDNLHKFLESSENENFAHVSPAEIPELIRDIRAHQSRPIAIGLQLLMLLAVRPAELRGATWAEFDLDAGLWTIPATRKKERREFVVPLAAQAVKLLVELKSYGDGSQWLLPGRNTRNDVPISNMTFNVSLDRMGYKGRQTPHGMRHLFSTAANEAGKEHRIVDAALAHKVKGTEGTYNKAMYLQQRRELMQWWADQIDVLAVSGLVKQAKA